MFMVVVRKRAGEDSCAGAPCADATARVDPQLCFIFALSACLKIGASMILMERIAVHCTLKKG